METPIDDLSRREMPIRLDPTGGALAEAGLGGGDTLGMVATEFHE